MGGFMTHSDHNGIEVTLWIIRWQDALARLLHSGLLASVAMFYLPIMVAACAMQVWCAHGVFSRGVLLALLWVAGAPFLIHRALHLIDEFLIAHKHVFKDQEEWQALRQRELARFQSSRYLLFGVPWATAGSLVVTFSKYGSCHIGLRVWSLVSFALLFLLSSMGFYGVYVLITLIHNVCNAELVFNPFHPDRFGGMASLGGFAVKGSLFFSSGALVLPLALEIMESLSSDSSLLSMVTYLLSGVFVAVMIASFIAPILEIKGMVDPQKEQLILDSRRRLEVMISEFQQQSELDAKKGVEILMYYYLTHSKLAEIKDYPWDPKVLLEFGASFIIPVGIALMELYAR
jgi:hypothetical protein